MKSFGKGDVLASLREAGGIGLGTRSVLGIACSPRKYGNSEILLKQCLAGAREAGSEINILRLTDFYIKQCRGCLKCVFSERGCPQQDDMIFLLDTINKHDALVLSSPTYFFGVPGIVKQLLDRLVMLYWFSRHRNAWQQGKFVVLLSVGGVADWNAFVLPLLACLGLVLGGTIKGSYEFLECPGPGEILLDEEAMDRARHIGLHLWDGKLEEDHKDACPVCHNRLFRIAPEANQVSCPLCDITGQIQPDGSIAWPDWPQWLSRWNENAVFRFIAQRIMPTRDRFVNSSPAIRKKKMAFLDGNPDWRWVRK